MIYYNYNIKDKNSFGLNCVVETFIEIEKEEDLIELDNLGIDEKIQILGGGSNSVFLKETFNGKVIHIKTKGKLIIEEDKENVIIEVMAGENWGEFVEYSINKNYSGIENLAAIPGDVGASPIQNIGAYGSELKEVFLSCLTYNPIKNSWKTYHHQDLKFDYRYSIFKYQKNAEIIWSVRFKLSKNFKPNLKYYAIENEIKKNNLEIKLPRDISLLVTKIRNEKLPDPRVLGNCGSFFKNPIISIADFQKLKDIYPDIPNYTSSQGIKIAAGWLIEKGGWKGKRVGNVGMHEKQALVMVNYGGGKGEEIYNLSRIIIESIKDKFNIELEIEAHLIK